MTTRTIELTEQGGAAPPGLPSVTAAAVKMLAALPLMGILAIQATLTLRLLPYLGSDHGDEAIYIYAGHQLIYELLHGGGTPYYETWFSGAPDIYPVLAAVADHVGGLTAAREMSMVFMLCATVLLFLSARCLFGYWVGVTAAGLFAVLGVTQSLGALATYDPMSLLLMAAAAYCAVRSVRSTRWLLLVPVALLAANAAQYGSVVFDPVVIALAAFLVIPEGWSRVWQRFAALGSAACVVTLIIVYLAGTSYFHGIMYTTLSRKSGANAVFGATFNSVGQIVSLSWEWIGAVVALGLLGPFIAFRWRFGWRAHGPLLILLVVAGMLVTLENVYLHTDQSMDKHDDFGVWFACIPAAYALAYLADKARRRRVKIPVIVITALAVGACGYHYSEAAGFRGYFYDKPVVADEEGQYGFLAPYLQRGKDEYLLASEYAYSMVYDDHSNIAWWQFYEDTYLQYPIPGRGDADSHTTGLVCGAAGEPPATDPQCVYLNGAVGYRAAIRTHWFALVTLVENHGLGLDATILAAVRSTPGYVQISDHDGAPTFIYAPDYPAWEKAHPDYRSLSHRRSTRHHRKGPRFQKRHRINIRRRTGKSPRAQRI